MIPWYVWLLLYLIIGGVFWGIVAEVIDKTAKDIYTAENANPYGALAGVFWPIAVPLLLIFVIAAVTRVFIQKKIERCTTNERPQ